MTFRLYSSGGSVPLDPCGHRGFNGGFLCFKKCFSFSLTSFRRYPQRQRIQNGRRAAAVAALVFVVLLARPSPRWAGLSAGLVESHDRAEHRLTKSNMVASLAGLRVLLMILLFCGIRYGACGQEAPQVVGLRLEDPAGPVCMKDRIISAPEGATFKLRLFGANLNGSRSWVAFAGAVGGAAAEAGGDAADPCAEESNRQESDFQVTDDFVPDENHSGLLTVEVRRKNGSGSGGQRHHHLCVLSGGKWASTGPDRLRVNTDRCLPADYIPPWCLAVLIVLLLLVCVVLRTVNLSLLWLDPVELYVLHSCGSEEEKRAAKRLEPIRRRGNFLVSAPGSWWRR